jgi:hypothetical protein
MKCYAVVILLVLFSSTFAGRLAAPESASDVIEPASDLSETIPDVIEADADHDETEVDELTDDSALDEVVSAELPKHTLRDFPSFIRRLTE